MKKIITFFLLFNMSLRLTGQVYVTEIPFEKDEYWWGGVVAYGARMPYLQPVNEFDLSLQNYNNQVVPLFLSNKGRYLWSDRPFTFEVKNRILSIRSDYEQLSVRQAVLPTLRGAYSEASQSYFPPSGTLPDSLFFTMPQYNTWIELMYNQNEKDILNYAQSIIDNDFPPGVLMIDDNWQKYYGNFEFKPDRFPSTKEMIKKLHDRGFKVMLWICPFVSPDSPEFRDLRSKGYLIRQKGSDEPALIRWWNGFSACYDLTNPAALEYLIDVLKKMQVEYGIDGFKLDAGDNSFYNPELIDSYKKDALSVDHTLAWAKVGLEFPFNEYRAGWKMGGQPLVQRLGDKNYSWDALRSLVPEMIAAGLLGYAYTCPDMIGGGQISSFLNLNVSDFDKDLIVRSAQVHALMPMMQFSVAPWRVLDGERLEMVRRAALLHQKFGDYIIECAKDAARTGEPIVRHLEYSFPGEEFAECKDQFMLGEKYLVAPMVEKGVRRTVKLPKGNWKDDRGKTYKGGGTVTLEVPLDRLVYFEKL